MAAASSTASRTAWRAVSEPSVPTTIERNIGRAIIRTVIDLPAHILPGLDDGPPTLDASTDMAAAAVAAGTRVMAATSHVNRGFGLLPEDLAPAREQLGEHLR